MKKSSLVLVLCLALVLLSLLNFESRLATAAVAENHDRPDLEVMLPSCSLNTSIDYPAQSVKNLPIEWAGGKTFTVDAAAAAYRLTGHSFPGNSLDIYIYEFPSSSDASEFMSLFVENIENAKWTSLAGYDSAAEGETHYIYPGIENYPWNREILSYLLLGQNGKNVISIALSVDNISSSQFTTYKQEVRNMALKAGVAGGGISWVPIIVIIVVVLVLVVGLGLFLRRRVAGKAAGKPVVSKPAKTAEVAKPPRPAKPAKPSPKAVKYCSSCGAKLKPRAKFCGECGEKVS